MSPLYGADVSGSIYDEVVEACLLKYFDLDIYLLIFGEKDVLDDDDDDDDRKLL